MDADAARAAMRARLLGRLLSLALTLCAFAVALIALLRGSLPLMGIAGVLVAAGLVLQIRRSIRLRQRLRLARDTWPTLSAEQQARALRMSRVHYFAYLGTWTLIAGVCFVIAPFAGSVFGLPLVLTGAILLVASVVMTVAVWRKWRKLQQR